MAIGASLKDDFINTDEQSFIPSKEFLFVRKLIVGREVKDVTFRAVEDADQLCAARDLLNDRYGWRGYGSAHNIPSGVHHTTFTAEVDQNVVGTITLAFDSESGLAIDETFGDEVNQIRRAEGAQICELTRLAFHSCIRSKEVLAGLFHFVFIYGSIISDGTDILIEINPRHTRFYETMLGFECIGPMKTNASVAAPSQLMRLKVDDMRENIDRLAGKLNSDSNRSLYHNFFPRIIETQIHCFLSTNAIFRDGQHDRINYKSNYLEFLDERATSTASVESLGLTLSPDMETEISASKDVRRAA